MYKLKGEQKKLVLKHIRLFSKYTLNLDLSRSQVNQFGTCVLKVFEDIPYCTI